MVNLILPKTAVLLARWQQPAWLPKPVRSWLAYYKFRLGIWLFKMHIRHVRRG